MNPPPSPGPERSETASEVLILDGTLDNLGRFRDFVRETCRRLGPGGPGREREEEVVLAVNEALVNVIRHALADQPGKPVALGLRAVGTTLVATLEDDGRPFDRTRVVSPAFDGTRESGFGIFIMEELADRVTYHRRPGGGNRWELVFNWQPGDGRKASDGRPGEAKDGTDP